MTTKEVIDYFDGSIRDLANFLGVSTQAIYWWGKHPPIGKQYELEVRTNGKLKADKQ